ncbi:uncharacterized protein LOC123983121 isoform X1 [Micropterus dolomieu]|uniref:uncharacterized protein LOC123983121 isoform X1 n=1 Tax=Micropterus dolomieu TaxID=147949 RepID=UPI001E8E5CA1|nr:uncharacterized protein LOC123983121 isoform X1 [Micropterus dolomieu]
MDKEAENMDKISSSPAFSINSKTVENTVKTLRSSEKKKWKRCFSGWQRKKIQVAPLEDLDQEEMSSSSTHCSCAVAGKISSSPAFSRNSETAENTNIPVSGTSDQTSEDLDDLMHCDDMFDDKEITCPSIHPIISEESISTCSSSWSSMSIDNISTSSASCVSSSSTISITAITEAGKMLVSYVIDEAVKALQSTDAAKTLQSTEAVKTPQSTEAVKTPQSTEALMMSQSTEALLTQQSTEVVNTLQSTEAVKTPQCTEAVKTLQSSEAVKTPQSTEAVKTPQSTEALMMSQSTEALLTQQSTEVVNTLQSTEAVKTPQCSEALKTLQSSEAVKTLQSTEKKKWKRCFSGWQRKNNKVAPHEDLDQEDVSNSLTLQSINQDKETFSQTSVDSSRPVAETKAKKSNCFLRFFHNIFSKNEKKMKKEEEKKTKQPPFWKWQLCRSCLDM